MPQLRALPGETVVRVTGVEGADELTVQDILAVPARVAGVLDGMEAAGGSQEGAFRFKLGWDASMAGKGFEDVCADAAVLAGHLAGRIPSWPGTEAHVRMWPQIDFTFQFECCPDPVPPAPPFDLPAALERFADSMPGTEMADKLRVEAMKMRKPPCDCGCECCG